MSHFNVLVIGNDVEQQLAPFQENNMGDCPKEYLQFFDRTDELKTEYENDSVDMAVNVNDPSDAMFVWRARDKGLQMIESASSAEKALSDPNAGPIYLIESRPLKLVYPTFEEFAQKWAGYEDGPIEDGRYGYYENPNRKWDWYLVGGRWTGKLKLKDPNNSNVGIGEPGVMTPKAEAGYVDQAMFGDIDFDGMMLKAGEEAAVQYDNMTDSLSEAGADRCDYVDWSEFYKRVETKELDITEARELYHDQPATKVLKDNVGPFAPSDIITLSREQYIKRARFHAISTFALLKDGKWYERGEMLMFGMVNDEQPAEDWEEQFMSLISDVDPKTFVTIVDCHI